MKSTLHPVLVRSVLLSAALMLSNALAYAQWQWVGSDGRKVFSDQAPPADVLEKNILKRPGGAKAAPAAVAAAPTAASGAAPAPRLAASTPRVSGKDAEIEKKKKEAAEAEEAKKKEEDEKFAKAKADNCERAKRSLANLTSGVRIQTQNDKGEREFISDAKRAQDTARAQDLISSDCK